MAFIVIYDANVLYPNTLRDLSIRIAQQPHLVQAKWTDQIIGETLGALQKNRPEAVGALAGGRVSVWMRFLGGVGHDGAHDLLQVDAGRVQGRRRCWYHLGGPPDFQAVHRILSVSVFDEKLRAGRLLPLLKETGEGGCGGHGPFEMMDLRLAWLY
jgi:hypothetical protein